MKKTFLFIAGISGALGVTLGALGAHALKHYLQPEALLSYEIAVRYQMYHSLALLIVALLFNKEMLGQSSILKWVGWLFVAGIICFSGSIYILSTRALTGIETISFIVPLTPIGGVLFITAWVMLAMAAIKK